MKPLREYGGDATVNAPGTILRYFLFEDSDVRDYDKQVGIVSRPGARSSSSTRLPRPRVSSEVPS
jgi:hypothetical protein